MITVHVDHSVIKALRAAKRATSECAGAFIDCHDGTQARVRSGLRAGEAVQIGRKGGGT